jgi:hypothetical protein
MVRETTDEPRLADHGVGELVRMAHGGALRNGGTNRGGPGRPPEVIRARSRAAYERILREIESRDLTEASLGELALLANTTARYGLGLANALEDVRIGGFISGVIALPPERPEMPHELNADSEAR